MVGDRIIATGGSVIVNKAKVENAFNKIQTDDGPELASAMRAVGQTIEQSNNPSAGAIFERFVEEAQKPQRDRKTLRDYWNTIVQLVPDVVKLTDAASKLAQLFG